MAETRLADISEFQSNIDAPAYLKAGNKCLIVRAHNGWRPDNKWPQRRDYLRGHPFTALGWYQYLVSSKDAAQQARDFIATVGALRANEFVVLDHEEGSGNQVPRAEAWFSIVDKHYGFPATLYAGLYFCKNNLGGWARWRRPRWLAAYQSGEPSDPHELWQYSSTGRFAGLSGGVDSNLFHGTDAEFLRKMRPGGAAPTPPAPSGYSPLYGDTVVPNKDGRLEAFEIHGQSVRHNWQKSPGGAFSGWSSLGEPGGALMVIACPNQDGRLEVFSMDSSGHVKHRWQKTPGGAFNDGGWADFGTVNTGKDITATRNKDGRMEVFVQAGNGDVWHRWQQHPNGNWVSNWSSMGGSK